VVDLVVDEAGEAAFVHGSHGLAVQGGDLQGAGDQAPDVEEAQAALALLVRLVRPVSNLGVKQDDGGGLAGWHDHCGGAADAALRSRDTHALGEGVDLADALGLVPARRAAQRSGPVR